MSTRHSLLGIALAVSLLSCHKKSTLVQGFPDAFSGIGVELRIDDDIPVVVRALPGGPSAQAGVLPGDRLVDIDGVDTRGLGLGNVVMRLRGTAGSIVRLTLVRQGLQLALPVTRASLQRQANDDYQPQR